MPAFGAHTLLVQEAAGLGGKRLKSLACAMLFDSAQLIEFQKSKHCSALVLNTWWRNSSHFQQQLPGVSKDVC